MPKRYLFTRPGLRRLKRQIADARAAYKAICDDNAAAAESGDSSVWHDNFAYEENQRQMHQLARRVRDLEALLVAAEVVMPGGIGDPRVYIGTWVRYQFEDDETPRIHFIAGYDDGDPPCGRISYNSPLGRYLMGACPGDVLEVRLAGRRRELEVTDVIWGSEEELPCLDG